jgi:hypothetical protein
MKLTAAPWLLDVYHPDVIELAPAIESVADINAEKAQ